MGSSPGFGSPLPTLALFRLGFPAAPPSRASPCRKRTLAGSFYKRHAVRAVSPLPLFVSSRFQVLFHSPCGVLFTFPSRYSALSVALGISPWKVVLPASHWTPRIPWYSGSDLPLPPSLRLRGSYPLWRSFPDCFASRVGLAQRAAALCRSYPSTPLTHRLQALPRLRFGLFPFRSPLLGKSLLIPFPPGTQMVHFPGCPPALPWCRGFPTAGCPIRRSPALRLLTAPRSVSPSAASFFGLRA